MLKAIVKRSFEAAGFKISRLPGRRSANCCSLMLFLSVDAPIEKKSQRRRRG
jgi:hypothetical protein